jgi:cell division protein FtsI (penicillin-binding protein 3)
MTGTLQENKIGFKGLEFINGEVPNVVGMGLKDALYELESKGMKVEFTGKGIVTGQSINAGEKIIKGQKISIELS